MLDKSKTEQAMQILQALNLEQLLDTLSEMSEEEDQIEAIELIIREMAGMDPDEYMDKVEAVLPALAEVLMKYMGKVGLVFTNMITASQFNSDIMGLEDAVIAAKASTMYRNYEALIEAGFGNDQAIFLTPQCFSYNPFTAMVK